MLTILGGLLGLFTSAFPAIIGYFKQKQDNAHELAMMDKQIEAQKVTSENQLKAVDVQGGWDEIKALITAQAQPSGVKWIDAISQSVRPVITYLFFDMYCAVKVACFVTIMHAGQDVAWTEALKLIWTEEDGALFAAIMAYWFGSRAMAKHRAGAA